MFLAQRSGFAEQLNAVAVARARLGDVALTDLSDTNPTRHGLTDPAITEALARAATRSGGYDPDPRGPIRARAALAERFGGEPGDYWLTPGTSQAYGWLFALLADPGEVVATPRPGYPLVEPLAQLAGIDVAYYPAHYLHPHGWEYDLDELAAVAARPGVRAVVAVHPNNPTGGYAPAALADACRGLPLIADEVFWPFDTPTAGPAPTGSKRPALAGNQPGGKAGTRPAASARPPRLSGALDHLVFGLDGFSKLLAAPQLKLGWIRLSGPRGQTALAAAALDRIADAYLPVSGPIAEAVPDLLALVDATVRRVRERLAGNLALAAARFDGGAYRVRRCAGGWTALVDVPRIRPDDELVVALLERGRLIVHPGWFYDLDDAGTLALSLLPSPAAFARGCELLRDTIDALG
ncbi:MAG: pyridoxal phosphate-dependent aminotransferase [Actinomycetia bacterium]|nr:pyridoxal phosphate-dependent aminotransferase [Actinomycetes bacterium]